MVTINYNNGENKAIEKVLTKLKVKKKYHLFDHIKDIISYIMNNRVRNMYNQLSEELELDVATIYRNLRKTIQEAPPEALEEYGLTNNCKNKEFIDKITKVIKEDMQEEKEELNA